MKPALKALVICDRIRNGERQAESELLDMLSSEIMKMARMHYWRCKYRDMELGDFLQEASIAVLDAAKTFTVDSDLNYFRNAIHWQLLDTYTRKKDIMRGCVELPDEIHEEGSAEQFLAPIIKRNGLDDHALKFYTECVLPAFRSLPQESQDILSDYYFEKYTLLDIAYRHNKSTKGHIHQIKDRILDDLRARIAERSAA